MEVDVDTINKLLGVDEQFKAPTAMMHIVFNRKRREALFESILELNCDLSFDMFRKYFEASQADRKKLKQDFTPQGVINVLNHLAPQGNTYYEVAAGTGGILVSHWWHDCLEESPIWYLPSNHLYVVEEMSDAAIPFLLANCMIRGMDAIVVHCDALERTAKQVYFVQNDEDDLLKFSSLNVMPHTDAVARQFGIRKWLEPAKEHIESSLKRGRVLEAMDKLRAGDPDAV